MYYKNIFYDLFSDKCHKYWCFYKLNVIKLKIFWLWTSLKIDLFWDRMSNLIMALFSSPWKPKSFQDSLSHRILWHMHETLNIGENKN